MNINIKINMIRISLESCARRHEIDTKIVMITMYPVIKGGAATKDSLDKYDRFKK